MRRIGNPRSPRPTWWTQYLAERVRPAMPASSDPAAENAFAAGMRDARTVVPMSRGVSRSPDAIEGFNASGVLVFAAERHTAGGYVMTFPTRQRIRSAIDATRTAACFGAVVVATRLHLVARQTPTPRVANQARGASNVSAVATPPLS